MTSSNKIYSRSKFNIGKSPAASPIVIERNEIQGHLESSWSVIYSKRFRSILKKSYFGYVTERHESRLLEIENRAVLFEFGQSTFWIEFQTLLKPDFNLKGQPKFERVRVVRPVREFSKFLVFGLFDVRVVRSERTVRPVRCSFNVHLSHPDPDLYLEVQRLSNPFFDSRRSIEIHRMSPFSQHCSFFATLFRQILPRGPFSQQFRKKNYDLLK